MEEKNVKSSPRDVFMYLLATVALYFSVFAVLNLISFYTDYFLPDPLNPYYQPGAEARWPIALLIVIFPVYLWVSRFLARDLRAAPEKKDLRIRRWLLYLTVFLAAVLLIGDLVALIYRFLEGDLALPFVLKVISIFVVGAAVFWYYLYDLRRQPTEFSSQARVFVWAASALVLVVVVCGFFVAGSPFRQRLVRFDEQRVNDLQNIQWQIVSFWQNKERLPANLEELKDSISGFVPPVDPQTKEAYGYKTSGSLSFELCAKFNLPSETGQMGQSEVPIGAGLKGESNWQHDAGEKCFARTIDPEIYRLDKINRPLQLP